MRNRRRSHSLQPINRAQIADSDFHEPHSLVSTVNLAQVLVQTTTQSSSSSQSPSASFPTPSPSGSPLIGHRITSRPTRPPPPPPRPPPYTSSIFDHLQIPSHLLNDATVPFYTEQRLNTLFRGLLPDPTNTRPRKSPLTFEPTRTVSKNIE